METGDRIRYMREENQLTQTELAEKIGISKQTLYKYENGVVTNIPSDKLEILADLLNTTPEYLIGWSDDPVDYKKSKIDKPDWWVGTIKGYLEYQKNVIKSHECDAALQSSWTAKDSDEQRLLMLCRKTGDIPSEEKEAIINQFEAMINMYLKAKGIKE